MLLSPAGRTPRVWLLTFASLRLSQPRTFVWTILPTSVVFTSTGSTTRGSRQQTSAFRLLLSKRQVLRQLWRFGARQQNTKLCVYAGRAWARLSCNLQTSVAQAILHRIPTGGNPPVKRTPVEVSVVHVDKVQVPSLAEPQVSLPSSFGPQVSVSSLSLSPSHVGPQDSVVSPLSLSHRHVETPAWSPLLREALAKKGLLSRECSFSPLFFF